jgi:hypothetical protein
MSNTEVEVFVRKLLEKEQYRLSLHKTNRETGVDIIAKKASSTLYIECIGYKKHTPTRSRDFFEVFFRVISRLNDGAEQCVIALPANFKKGFPQRTRQYSVVGKELVVYFLNYKYGLLIRTK